MLKAAKRASHVIMRSGVGRHIRRWRRVWTAVLVGILMITVSGCGGSAMGPSATPTDLSGTWYGVVGSGSGGGRALRLTWSATQAGNTISGPAAVTTSPAVSDVIFTGTLSGTLTGMQLSLSYVSNTGNIPVAPDCSASGRGTGAVTGGSIAGQLDVSFTSCDALGLQAPASDQFTLTKQ
jgi:hypothetical protein